MTHSLFNAPAGGSLQDKVNQALRFAQGARTGAAAVPPEVEALRGLAAEAGEAAPQVAASAATEVAAPVVSEVPDLAAAARVAAEQAIADPAFATAAQQQVDVVVSPRLIVQGQSGPTVIPIDVPVPAAQANVTIAPATAVVIDPATGHAVAAQAAQAAPDGAAVAAPVRGFRSWGIDELAGLGRRGGIAPASVPAGDVVADAAAGAAAPAAGAGWRAQLADALAAARGPAASPADVVAVAADAVPAAARPGLLDRVRASGPSLADLAALGRSGGAASVVDDAAATAAKAAGSARGASLLDQLRDAAQVVQRINPKG